MQPCDEKKMLDSMIILVDRREQQTERAKKRYQTFGIPYHKATLDYGDYSYNAMFPDGDWLYDESNTVRPCAVIERKMNLDELANCLTHSRERFEHEFLRAKAYEARMILLVEDANWENLKNGRYQSRFNQNAFSASLCSWLMKYNIQLVFCKQETSGKLIRELLYWDLRNRIERGDFDIKGYKKGNDSC